MVSRLIANWVYGGSLAGILFFLLTPVLTSHWNLALVATYLCLPAYMLHQFEEHDRDRFRLFVNATLGRGKELLTPRDVFLINIPGVWGVIGTALALAVLVDVGYGLIAAYLLLSNALVHMGHAAVTRRYNPGLDTAVAVFLPLSIFTLETIRRSGGGTLGMHLLGAGCSLAIHAAIAGYVTQRLRQATA